MTRITVSAVLLALAIPATSYAHVSVRPRETKPGVEETYTARVPTEKAVATTSVVLEVPDGVTILKVADAEGMKHEETKTGDRITTITWTREIKPRESAEFVFTAKNPATGAQIVWKVHQHYADGTVSDWMPATTLSPTEAKDR